MVEENQIAIKPKLNFFQRIRKNSLIKKINIANYNNAPEYLKQDEDVIMALVSRSPRTMFQFPMPKRLDLLKTSPDFFDVLEQNQKFEIVRSAPEYIVRLNEHDSLSLVLSKHEDFALTKHLPKELQVSLLTETKEYLSIPFWGEPRKEETSPDKYSMLLNHFSEEAVLTAVISLIQRAKSDGNSNSKTWQELRKSVPLLSKMHISELPEALQLKLGLLDNEFISIMSEDTALKFVGQNPLLFKLLSKKAQLALLSNNPEMFLFFDSETKRNLLYGNYTLMEKIPEIEKIKYSDFFRMNFRVDDISILKGLCARSNKRDVVMNAKLTDYLRGNVPGIEELARFEPSVLSLWALDNAQIFHKIEHTTNMYLSHINYPEAKTALKTLSEKLKRPGLIDSFSRNRIAENLPKILLNEKVLEQINSNSLIEFLDNPQDINVVKDIVEQAYGKQAREILDERPNITLDLIPNLYIFDPIVFEKFGKGTVDNMLSYDSNAPAVLSELVRYPEKMKKFEEFARLFEDINSDTLEFNNLLIAFQHFEKTLNKLDLNSLTESQRQNLLLAYNDKFMTFAPNETALISVNSPEELETYADRRNVYYDDVIEKTTSIVDIKNAIARKFFGMQYADRIDTDYHPTNLSLNSMLYYYNIESFISDERTINSGQFSQDDLDMLQLAVIIQKIDDPNVLKIVNTQLSSRNDVLRPADFSIARKKIPMQYSQELANSLLTTEQAKERIANGEKGIEYEKTEDGLEIITLKGADFRIMLHTTGLNNSGLNIPFGINEKDLWKTFENGCSTVSCCVIEPEMLYSCAHPRTINLGFANVPANQIIGMSHQDAHVDHTQRSIEPNFEYRSVLFNYPDELIRKTAAQISGIEAKDVSHAYNEVTMYRQYVGSQNPNTHGQRIMPSYIVVYDTITEEQKQMARDFSNIAGSPIPIIQIDVKEYGDYTYSRATRKEDHSTERTEGKIVKDIKSIVEDDNTR